ncbi:unnamed protein product [Anisakis simplex]|uniref:Uncharacterized protein n=1 Tax=Anisakis simplex TaxID=6269 RepID=A0A3P6NVE9_ANISI|nr:unnamed protein product [Anisakis simplex]
MIYCRCGAHSKSAQRGRHSRDLSPLQWDAFFDKKIFVDVGEDKFCVYLKGDNGPVFYLLHGGGYSGLTWACFTVRISF